jgi:hypothetical protein
VRAGADTQAPVVFDRTFIAAAWARPEIALELVSAGFAILSMDVDMVLFRDLRAAWPATEPDFIITACDGLDTTAGDFNTGAMLLTHEHHPRALRAWLGSCSETCRSGGLNEQGAFQLMGPPLKKGCLDPRIVNHLYFQRPPDPLTNAAFNFIGIFTAEGKPVAMSLLGLWFLPCDPSKAMRGGEAWKECVPRAHPLKAISVLGAADVSPLI